MVLSTLFALSAYLVVDGAHWYSFQTREPLVYHPATGSLFLADATTRDCSGIVAGAGALLGDHALHLGGAPGTSLQLTGSIVIHRIGDRLRIDAATGDPTLSCDGEVPEPVFVSSFELR